MGGSSQSRLLILTRNAILAGAARPQTTRSEDTRIWESNILDKEEEVVDVLGEYDLD